MSVHEFDYQGKNVCIDDGNSLTYSACYKNNKFYESDFLTFIKSLGLHGIYLDIGTNIGNHVIYFSKYANADRVIGFEPILGYFQLANRNILSNGLKDKCEIYNIGLGSESGNFIISFGCMRQMSVVKRLDDVLEGVKDSISMVKIDVEGMEIEVLKGAKNIILKHKPLIYLEAIQSDGDMEIRSLEKDLFLESLGYQATGRVFNYQPTIEYIHKDLITDIYAFTSRKFIDLRDFSIIGFGAEVEQSGRQSLVVDLQGENGRIWLSSSFEKFDNCGANDFDFELKDDYQSIFLEFEGCAEGDIKYCVHVSQYSEIGVVVSKDKFYVNRRTFRPLSNKIKASRGRVFFEISGSGRLIINKLAVTLVS
jgi:FkbM family methyltransferase